LLLVPEGVAIAVPIEQFDSVGAFVGKDKEVAREWFFDHNLFNKSGKAIVTFAAIDGRSSDKDAERARDAQHDLLQIVSSTA
jgi:hypothetical protein